ncbi:DUF349 domain-containing protein [Fulvivirga sp. RKSG066]|uniref:DUF349 domain-containing protein n=1 Tax=Fulvivirga aurantia TaxID=2529383 RepID=UPI0012BC2B3E|nr:DUF349 domain-containing protein [Fulvivirga aurantia]MTI20665.1 DUF349 domain-containing protein [Fulvivirga aurantia]
MDNEKDIKEVEQNTANLQESAEQKTAEEKSEVNQETTSEQTEVTEQKAEATEDAIVASEEKDTGKTVDEKALHSEEDLEERHEEDHEDDHDEEIDYTTLSKEELVELIKSLAKEDKFIKAEKIAREIKPLFDEIRNAEREDALKKFIANGGVEEDFEFKNDELANRFDANFKLIRDRKNEFVRTREQQKDKNLKRKQEILERLREFVDSEETNISFDDFKALQDEWKSIGQVPGAYARTLWANYNALIDRFYDNRSIYFELKELDRKKNLEGKLELCQRAEDLSNQENLKEAIKELNELHHEFKHIGPVPKEDQEPLWQRFKAASDAVYDRRRAFVENLKGELEENLKVKEELVEEVQAFTSYDSDRIKEWNNKTKEILDIQKKWEATGGLPRAKAKDINKRFWGAFKTFFNNKNAFFKRLDAGREDNLIKKKELLEKAVELKESTDWQKTAEAFKRLQREWKEIGPVPEKQRGIYKDFKAAADAFFENKRANNKELEKEFEQNLQEKVKICEQIEAMADNKADDLDAFRELRDNYMDIGFVPRKNISEIKSKYAEAVDKYINSLEGISNEDRQRIRLENQLNRIVQGPNADQKLYRKEQSIRKQISKVESDIALWKNNIEFFAESKTADKMKDEFNEKIQSAQGQLKNLKQQLKIVRTAN